MENQIMMATVPSATSPSSDAGQAAVHHIGPGSLPRTLSAADMWNETGEANFGGRQDATSDLGEMQTGESTETQPYTNIKENGT